MMGLICSGVAGWGQVSLTALPSTVNFDGMGTSATATLPSGFRVSSGTTYSGGTSATTVAAGTTGTGVLTGSSTGGTYNFANGVTGSATDRALGFLTSSGFSSPRSIIVQMTNNTGATINTLAISFNYEKYRSGSRAFDWTFFHGSDGSAWTPNTSGNQSYAADADNTIISNPPTSITKTLTISSLTILNGANYYIMWTLTGNGGPTNGQGLGIDDFSIYGSSLKYWDTNGSTPGVGGSGIWNTTSFNTSPFGTNSGTAAAITDDVVFAPTAGTITLDANQTANGLLFTVGGYSIATSGTPRTLTGSIVLGTSVALTTAPTSSTQLNLPSIISSTTGSLVQNGAGTTVLSGVNTYAGGTTVTSGTLSVAADAHLGAGNITLNGGTLAITNTFTTAKTVAASSASIIDVASGQTATFSADGFLSGSGNLTKVGAGTLVYSLGSNLSYTGKTTINAGLIAVKREAMFGDNPPASPGFIADQITLNGGGMQSDAIFDFNTSNRGITIGPSGGTFKTDFQLTLANAVTGAGKITKTGTDALVLSGAHTYSGGLDLNMGTLVINNATGLGTSAGTFTISTGTTIDNTSGGLITNNNNNPMAWNGNFTFTGSNNLNLGTGNVSISNHPQLTVTNNTLTVGGVISGSTIGLTKAGAGTLVLNAANAYTGATTISAGTLSIGTIANGGVASGIGQSGNAAANLVLGGGTLSYTGSTATIDRSFTLTNLTTSTIDIPSNSLTIAGASANTSGGLIKTGAGTLVLSGANAHSGGTTLSAGTLTLSNNAAAGSGLLTIQSGYLDAGASNLTLGNNSHAWTGNFTFIGTNNLNLGSGNVAMSNNPQLTVTNNTLTVGGVISGTSVSLTKLGANGTLVFNNANTYTGPTTISAGTLSVATVANGGIASGIGASGTSNGNLVIGNATLQYTGGTTTTDRNFTLTAGTTATIDVNDAASSLTISGAAAGTGGLTKAGAGTLVLTGNNAYTGITTISAGTLSIPSINSGSIPSVIGASTNAAANLVLGGGTLQYTSGSTTSGSTSRSFTLSANSTINVSNSAGILTISGAASTGTGSLTKTGAGTLILSAPNSDASSSYSGGTVIAEGTLEFQVPIRVINNNGPLGTGTVTLSGGTLQFNVGNSATFARGITLTNSTTSSISIPSNPLNVSGLISSGGSLIKTGAGQLTLSNASNSYTGATTINAGTLIIPSIAISGSNSPIGASSSLAANLVLGGGTLQYTANPGTATNRAFTLTDNTTSTINVSNASGTLTISGQSAISTGGLIKSGSGTLVLSGANQYTGATTINAGTLSIPSIANGGTNSPIGASGIGAANLVLGGGTLLYSNTLTDGITDRAFTLTASTTSTINVSNASRSLTISGQSAISSGGLIKAGSGTLVLSGANQYSGGTTLSAGTLTLNNNNAAGTGLLSISGGNLNAGASNLTLGNSSHAWNGDFTFTGGNSLNLGTGAVSMNASRQVTVSASTLTVGGVISGNVLSLTKAGSGILVLGGTNTFSGGLAVNAGTLSVGADAHLGAGSITLGGGTLAITNTFTTTKTVAVGSASIIDVALGQTATFSTGGFLTGSGNLTKSGAGTLEFSGTANGSFSGKTIINAGFIASTGESRFGGNPGGFVPDQITLNGGGVQATGGIDFNSNRGITLGSSGGTFQADNTITLTNVVTGAGKITKTGAGTLILNGAHTYSGGLDLNAGILAINNATGLGTVAGTFTIGAGTTIDNTTAGPITNSNNNPMVWNGDFTFTGTNSLNLGNGAVTMSANRLVTVTNNTLTVGGTIGGSNITLTKAGGGILVLSGANTYTGLTTVNAGTLQLNNASNTTLPATNNVTIAGGNLQVSVNQILNNVTLNSGTLTIDEGDVLTINGTLTINGGSISGTGTITTNASSSLSFGENAASFTLPNNLFTSNPAITNFTMDRSGGLTLGNQPITVSGTLAMTNGIITNTAANQITLGMDGTITGGSSASFFTGPLAVQYPASGKTIRYPVGKSTSFRPLTFTSTNAAIGTLTGEYFALLPPGLGQDTYANSLTGLLNTEHWQLERSSGTTEGTITLPYVNPGGNNWRLLNDGTGSSPCTYCNVAIVKRSSNTGAGTWDFPGFQSGGFTDPGSGTPEARPYTVSGDIISKNVNSFSYFGFGYAFNSILVLPITLGSFTAQPQANGNQLFWQMQQQSSLLKTAVMYSRDGVFFQTIGVLARNDSSNAYRFDHNGTGVGTHFYRLTLLGNNGQVQYSPVLKVQSGNNSTTIGGLAPNPVRSNRTSLQLWSARPQMLQVSITDVTGRVLQHVVLPVSAGAQWLPIALPLGLLPGLYRVQVTLADGVTRNMALVKE